MAAHVPEQRELPARFIELKKQLVKVDDPEAQERFTAAWKDLLAALADATRQFKKSRSEYIPQVDFTDLAKVSEEEIARIKTRGCVVIRNVVDDDEVLGWKEAVKDYVAANPSIPGMPEDNKQFFHMYWSKSQVRARAHPNVLASQLWLNSLYNTEGIKQEDVELDTPLTYADRLRIRKPGSMKWLVHLPHIDGGAIERWEDPGFRSVYEEILNGNWKAHDPYNLKARLGVNSNIYGMPGQASIFRSFQGWLSMSETGPNQGTLQGKLFNYFRCHISNWHNKVFPDVVLSNAYLILRPFFYPITVVSNDSSDDPLSPENWEFNTSTSDFPGILADDNFFFGPFLSKESHPHLNLEESMISVPHVKPGDMVYWHCDLIHAVETEHYGSGDSSVMYIPAVPATPKNLEYVEKQKEHFLRGAPPPDFPQNQGEIGFQYLANDGDIEYPLGRKAMGLSVSASA